jgi:hypothetical protein
LSNPYVHPVGEPLTDLDGLQVTIGVDHDAVTISGTCRLDGAQAEQFAGAFVAACWEAGRQARQMAEEAMDDASDLAAVEG